MRGLKRKLSDTNLALNMGLMLDALTELEHPSQKLQSRNVTLPERYCLICQKYHMFQSITKTPERIL
jgi:phosphoribosyl-dephospho-CoA transferase